MSAGVAQTTLNFDQLRTELGLPSPGPIDPEGLDIDRLPLVRMARVDVKKMTDEQLITAYRRAAMLAVSSATAKLVPEVISRESVEGKVDAIFWYFFDRQLKVVSRVRSPTYQAYIRGFGPRGGLRTRVIR